MANILPPKAQKEARGFYQSRFVTVGSLVAIVCGVIGLAALLPVYAMVRDTRGDTGTQSAAAQPLPESSDREDLARTRLILKELSPYASSTTSSLTMLGEIFGARPAGTIITSISLKRGLEGELSLSGSTLSRDDINAFREALIKNPRFTSVTVPIGVLAGTAGSRFTITLKGKF